MPPHGCGGRAGSAHLAEDNSRRQDRVRVLLVVCLRYQNALCSHIKASLFEAESRQAVGSSSPPVSLGVGVEVFLFADLGEVVLRNAPPTPGLALALHHLFHLYELFCCFIIKLKKQEPDHMTNPQEPETGPPVLSPLWEAETQRPD